LSPHTSEVLDAAIEHTMEMYRYHLAGLVRFETVEPSLATYQRLATQQHGRAMHYLRTAGFYMTFKANQED